LHPLCEFSFDHHLVSYSLRFKIKVTFRHRLRYEIKVTFGEISPKLRQTNWNVAINNVNVVVDELPSQISIYTCLTTSNWTRRCRCTSTWFGAIRPKWQASSELVPKKFDFNMDTLARWKALSESYAIHVVLC
jgi:hypothetical protein